MNADHRRIWGIPLLFFLITLIAYGLLLPQTGFYWDDWPFVWIAKFLGPAEFFPAFSNIRPFLAPIFFLTTSLIPPEPIYWQIFMLIIRFVSGLLAWFTFRQVWPQHSRAALVASLLFLVFPGYSQHWVAFTHINQEWIAYLFYLLSFGFTARALRNPSKFGRDTLIALFFLLLGLFPTEYFFGLEPLRFLFIWVIVTEQTKGFRQRLMQSFKLWLPYVVIWLVNAAWLAYFFLVRSFGSYSADMVGRKVSLLGIFKAAGEAIWKAGFYIWTQVLVLASGTITSPSSLLTLVIIAICCAILFFYLKRFESPGNGDNGSSWSLSMILIGIAGILLGRLPSFAAGLPLTLQSSMDRFMISMMIGGSLFITGLVEFVIRNDRIKTIVFAALIALGIGQQFYNANIFRRDWVDQQQIYWQLAWRIPDMQPGTLLITDELPVDYETDLSFTAPLNWIYAPDYTTHSAVPYGLIYTETRLGGSLPSLEPGQKINVYLRTAGFNGSTSRAIVIYKPRNGCLRVLGSEWNDEITYEGKSRILKRAIRLSDPALIKVNSQNTPALPFLSEPKHEWCYYYAKAELARQKGDWQTVNHLLQAATSLGYQPDDPLEWLIFIEAQARMGNMVSAQTLSDGAYESDSRTRKGLCQLWKRVQSNLTGDDSNASLVQALLEKFQCNR
jgi:hypothetical protein